MKSYRPIDCTSCKKDCTIHLTQILNGKVNKVDMCEHCPHSKMIKSDKNINLMDFLINMNSGSIINSNHKKGTVCPECGMGEHAFKKTLRFGCVVCYQVFEPQLKLILSQTQKYAKHTGKIPTMYQDREVLRQKIQALKEELEKAISKEDYEKAAQLRDDLNSLSL